MGEPSNMRGKFTRKHILIDRRHLFLGVGGDIFPLHLEVGPVMFTIKHWRFW